MKLDKYLEILEKEYFSFLVRNSIARNTFNKKFFEEVYISKRRKAISVAKRAGIKSIFDDDERMDALHEEFFSGKYPPFHYKDENDNVRRKKDFENFYRGKFLWMPFYEDVIAKSSSFDQKIVVCETKSGTFAIKSKNLLKAW